MSTTRLKTKILVDGGDPKETQQVKERLGFVDGQTTNPSLIAKNPHIKELSRQVTNCVPVPFKQVGCKIFIDRDRLLGDLGLAPSHALLDD